MDPALPEFLTENAAQFSCVGAATEFYGKTFDVMDPATGGADLLPTDRCLLLLPTAHRLQLILHESGCRILADEDVKLYGQDRNARAWHCRAVRRPSDRSMRLSLSWPCGWPPCRWGRRCCFEAVTRSRSHPARSHPVRSHPEEGRFSHLRRRRPPRVRSCTGAATAAAHVHVRARGGGRARGPSAEIAISASPEAAPRRPAS